VLLYALRLTMCLSRGGRRRYHAVLCLAAVSVDFSLCRRPENVLQSAKLAATKTGS
jgi:hypothetical protein